MNYAIISDIHGYAKPLALALSCADRYECAQILLLGDLIYHGPRNTIIDEHDPQATANLLNENRNRIIAVRGNCDAEVDQSILQFPIMSPTNILMSRKHRIFMTHGHHFTPVNSPLEKGDLFLFGHTHVSFFDASDNINIFNPGSISLPKKTSIRTMGILSEEDNRVMLIDIDTCKVLRTETLVK
jgi:putative phosphoesterase